MVTYLKFSDFDMLFACHVLLCASSGVARKDRALRVVHLHIVSRGGQVIPKFPSHAGEYNVVLPRSIALQSLCKLAVRACHLCGPSRQRNNYPLLMGPHGRIERQTDKQYNITTDGTETRRNQSMTNPSSALSTGVDFPSPH